jgi:hypothetical protein
MRYRYEVKWRILGAFSAILLLQVTTAPAVEPSASVDSKEGWKLTGRPAGVAIYSRPHPGSPVKEFRAIGQIDAPTPVVNAVIDDFENYTRFMPFTTECRLIKREGGDTIVGYQRLSPKVVADRDYTLRVWNKSWSSSGGPVFLNWWSPANELGPAEIAGVVRVKVCDGRWLLEPEAENKTRATYSVYTDSGGLIPAFLANQMSQVGISRLFQAVRKQAKNSKYSAATD